MRHHFAELAKGIAAPLEGAKVAAQIAFDAADWRRVTGGVLEEGVAVEMGPKGIELVREEQVGLVALGVLAKGRGEPAQPVHARTRTRATCREGSEAGYCTARPGGSKARKPRWHKGQSQVERRGT